MHTFDLLRLTQSKIQSCRTRTETNTSLQPLARLEATSTPSSPPASSSAARATPTWSTASSTGSARRSELSARCTSTRSSRTPPESNPRPNKVKRRVTYLHTNKFLTKLQRILPLPFFCFCTIYQYVPTVPFTYIL